LTGVPTQARSLRNVVVAPLAAAVVNVHVRSAASALPAASFTPEAPPLTVAV
jgi:hypothetical protein